MGWLSQVEMFMPHGMCLLWRPELMSLHIVSDALIALAYFTIPFAILRFVRGRDDLDRPQLALALLFTAFIALCGVTHIVSIVVLWLPIYVIEGWLKAMTAIVSVATAVSLLMLVPQLLRLPSASVLKSAVETSATTEGELRVAYHDLRQSVLLLEAVVEAVPGFVYAKDRSSRFLLANRALLDLLGKPWDEVKGRSDLDVLPDPHQAETVMANDRRVMELGSVQELEEIADHPTRGTRIYHSTKVPFEDIAKGISGVAGFSVDITKRKEAEKEFLHVARRSAMGDMAAAIAHEVNQPLAAISMYLAGSLALLEQDSYQGPLIHSLVSAKDQCVRAGAIIKRVRSFVYGGSELKRPENIVDVIDEACSLAFLGVRDSNIVTSIEHGFEECRVLIDKVQIEQVIVNLVRNAIDAMGSAKNMTLRVTTGYDLDRKVAVTVSDSGPGISEDVGDRLFEAFVSTKGVKGMGVGLSICRTIVEGHGGKITADRNERGGATFRFTLPQLVEQIAS